MATAPRCKHFGIVRAGRGSRGFALVWPGVAKNEGQAMTPGEPGQFDGFMGGPLLIVHSRSSFSFARLLRHKDSRDGGEQLWRIQRFLQKGRRPLAEAFGLDVGAAKRSQYDDRQCWKNFMDGVKHGNARDKSVMTRSILFFRPVRISTASAAPSAQVTTAPSRDNTLSSARSIPGWSSTIRTDLSRSSFIIPFLVIGFRGTWPPFPATGRCPAASQ